MGLFTKSPPWYAAGLAFECIGCGRCCAGPEEGYVWVTAEEIRAIARHLGISEKQMRRRYARRVGARMSLVELDESRDCVFLEPDGAGGRRCRIYPVRPTQCRTWPFWPGNLRSPDAWCAAAARCPGINRGPRYSREQIEERMRRTRA